MISDFNGNYGEMLADVAADLLHDSDPRLSLGKIFRRVSPHTSSRIWLAFAPRGERPQLVFAGGLSLNLADLQQPSYSASLSELAARPPGASPLSFEEAPADPVLQLLAQAGVRTLVNYTLSSGARLVGSLVFASHATSGFTPGEMKFHQALADEIAIAFGRDLLQEELARKDLQLLATATELQRAQAELEQIALVASHDLREPVRHLSIYAELLDRSLQPDLDREAAQYLRFLLTSAKRVELLVADLLAYTGIRHDEPSPRPVDPEIVAARVCWRLRELIQQSGAQIRLKPLPALYMGEDDLALFLENLIESCLRRSSPDVTPLICIYSEGTSEHPVICIHDNSPALSADEQSNIFNPAPSSDRSNNIPSSLGLNLCRKIVERYNGRIWVESAPESGSVFRFTLNSNVLRPLVFSNAN